MESRGLLGEQIIMLSGGGNGNVIPPGGVIRNALPARSFDEAIENFSELSATLKEMFKGGEGKPSINDIIENTTRITEDIRGVVEGRRGDLDQVISNLRDITDSVQEFVKSDDEGLKEMAQSLRQTMDRLDTIVARIERGEGTVGRLLKDEETVNRINDALDGVNEFVGALQQTEIAVGFRGEYMSSEGEPIAVTSLRLRPTFDKYFLFEVTDAPLTFGRRRKTITTTTTDSGTVRIEEVKVTDRFTFTALFARRFHFMTLHAGLIRSTGGIGAEFHFFRDRLELAAQFFDLKREENAQLRTYARINLWEKALYVQGGVDDIFHRDGRRNWFLGAGLMITDEDLKRFISFAPLALSQ
jgi:phospholipid/cholesterol/gamma-HCH transport system substrate-binding protein